MKQPVWILNSSLLLLCCVSQFLLFILQQAVPRRASMTPHVIEVEQEKTIAPVDVVRIYQQDLFGTYQPPLPSVKSVVEDTVPAIPLPPAPVYPDVPVERAPTFFAPLDVVLKGVIFVKDDPSNCIAIVQLKKTKEERNYQVGDFIEDAQILKILSNRIILIRSNGQQETLYLREEDAVSDFNTQIQSDSRLVVEDGADNKYIVNIDEFAQRIHNLGEFITLLDLTTVYKHGKSFGCRVGKIDKDSLAAMLGFMVDDIIVKIDEYQVDDLQHRIQAYDHMVSKQAGQFVDVCLLRNDQNLTLRYALVDNAMKSFVLSPQELQQRLMQELSKHEAEEHHKVKKEIEKAVVVQSLYEQDNQNELRIDEINTISNTSDSSAFEYMPEEKINVGHNFTMISTPKKDTLGVVRDSNSLTGGYSQGKTVVTSGASQTLNEADMYKKRLMFEREKLSSTVNNLRTQDKKNMMQRSSKNVILNGLQ